MLGLPGLTRSTPLIGSPAIWPMGHVIVSSTCQFAKIGIFARKFFALRMTAIEIAHGSRTQSGVPVRSLYGYVWQASRRAQFLVCILTMIIAPLPMAYLEL